jgi:hypothetical protein
MTSFVDLQQRFIEAEFAALGAADGEGQVLQPASPLPADDNALWSFFNAFPSTPPIYTPVGGDTFFQAYSALIDSLIPGSNPLDPIKVAKQRLAEWGDQPAAWSVDYAGLVRQLQVAPAIKFPFANDAASSPAFWGLWGNSEPASGPSVLFAAGDVTGQFKFGNALLFAPTPSSWYVSSALSLAYATKTGRPWNPDSPINWQTTFGQSGNMQRFVAGIFIASGLNVQYTSSAKFSKADQHLINESVTQGMWPYYLGTADASTKVQFNAKGQMTVGVTSRSSPPIVIAASVLSASRYLGG